MARADGKEFFDHAGLEAAKWIALVSMTIDHYGKIVRPELFMETHAIGRLSFPLLAGIVGVRLAASPELGRAYLRRLLAWGLVSQPMFVVAGRPWHDANILITLALGVVTWQAVEALRRGTARRPAWWLLGAVPLAFFTEFGPLGVLMPAATAWLARRNLDLALLSFGPLGVAANLVLEPPWLTPVDCWALLAAPLALASRPLSRKLPRLPGPLFYAYYPSHLLALHWWDLWG